jgi:hypothetical protein
MLSATGADAVLDAMRALQRDVFADPDVCVAVLDGPVDVGHPCFRGANLRRVDTLVRDVAGEGAMSAHGTHVASVILGQPMSGTLGLAAGCRGLSLPVFRDKSGYLSQLDLARAIEQAVLEGAHIINVSGGEKTPNGEPDPILARALNLCEQSNVLVVAATGNDGCDCVHVPAALVPALAVGAMDRTGVPVASSNYGKQYGDNGVLAPGERIPGAVPGGAITQFSGSSFATPIVSAMAALLMSLQKREGGEVDARAVRAAILESAIPCQPPDAPECARYLAGTLNVRGAQALTTRGERIIVTELDASPHEATTVGPWGAAVDTSAGIAPSAAPEVRNPQPGAATGYQPSEVAPSPGSAAGAVPGTGPAQWAGGAPSVAPLDAPLQPASAPPAAAAPGAPGAQASAASSPGHVPEGPAAGAAPSPAAAPPQAVQGGGGVDPACTCGGQGGACSCGGAGMAPSGAVPSQDPPNAPPPGAAVPVAPPPEMSAGPPVPPDATPGSGVLPGLTRVFAIGNIGFDFGTEARRDTFRQLMAPRDRGGSPPVVTEANPYDVRELYDYLEGIEGQERDFPPHRYDSTKLIWTLELERTPIYALEAEVAYAEDVYRELRTALRNQAQPADDPNYVSRVSVPGVLTSRTVRLYSGQVIPVVVAQPRGLFLWNEAALVDAVVEAVDPASLGADVDRVRLKVRQMLDKVYYQLRNLGQSPPDRAINFLATNAFMFTDQIARGLLSGEIVDGDTTRLYTMDTITAVKSPYCRVDSDCWDVQISFFDPDNDNRAQVVLQTTIDVSDELPVSLAPAHQFLNTG